MNKENRAIIIIPTYNESKYIEKLMLQILELYPQVNILVVDDNSPDGTGRLVSDFIKKTDKVMLLSPKKRNGLGAAYRVAMEHILRSLPDYERITQMDADFSHSPRYLKDLMDSVPRNDFSIGSRYIEGGKIKNWSPLRRVISYLANIYVRFWLNLKIKDCTGGFRCFRREVLEKIDLGRVKSNSYLFQVEILFRCVSLGYKYSEVPITFLDRVEGKSKFAMIEVWKALWGVLRLRFKS